MINEWNLRPVELGQSLLTFQGHSMSSVKKHLKIPTLFFFFFFFFLSLWPVWEKV